MFAYGDGRIGVVSSFSVEGKIRPWMKWYYTMNCVFLKVGRQPSAHIAVIENHTLYGSLDPVVP